MLGFQVIQNKRNRDPAQHAQHGATLARGIQAVLIHSTGHHACSRLKSDEFDTAQRLWQYQETLDRRKMMFQNV